MKKSRGSVIHPDDAKLFRASMSDVTPLARAAKAEVARPLPRPVPAQRLSDNRETLRESLREGNPWDAGLETGEELSYARSGIGAPTLRKLRRGHWVIQAELDLHGLTVEEAHAHLVEFLNRCVRRGHRCVRVIHGKGLRSKNREPVLKRNVAGWLMRRQDVLAFCQARRTDGGGGAVVVLLQGNA